MRVVAAAPIFFFFFYAKYVSKLEFVSVKIFINSIALRMSKTHKSFELLMLTTEPITLLQSCLP